MIGALMIYGAIATGILLIGGLAMELAFSGSRLRRRFVWSGVMVMSAGIVGSAGWQAFEKGSEAAGVASAPPQASSEVSNIETSPLSDALAQLRSLLFEVLDWPGAVAKSLETGGAWLVIMWGVASCALITVGVVSVVRYRRALRGWPVAEIEGMRVRVSTTTGPAVIGLMRPEIVVPRWLLHADAEDRRLAIAHEHEHLRARDGLLLAVGWLLVALLPWNAALWWMLFRLRLSIEIDCDQRVLTAGAERRQYGRMLIDLSEHGSGLSLTAPALAGFPSTLERRLVAMTEHSSGRSRVLRAFAGTAAALAVLTACGSELPTAAEIEALDAQQVEAQARLLGIDSTSFFVDGQQVTGEQAKALAPEEIGSVQVRRGFPAEGGSGGTVHIQTKAAVAAQSGDPLREIVVVGRPGPGPVSDTLARQAAPSAGLPVVVVEGYGAPRTGVAPPPDEYMVTVGFARPPGGDTPEAESIRINANDPLYVINGVTATAAEFNRLSPASIQSISILKEGSSTAQYSDPRARNGVVLITTKSATD